ncbi:MAG: thioredoxin domain-containing protein [Patescibacteria group bacterium]
MENLTKKEKRILKKEEKLANRGAEDRRKIFKKYFLWSAVFILFGAAIFGFVKIAPDLAKKQTASLALAVNESDWFKGGENAPAALVEYSDFQCPACASYAPLVRALAGEFGSGLKIVYRHFPLNQIHKNADLAARAAEAAGRQGKFWEMHDLIFDNQKQWSDARKTEAEKIFAELAEKLGLDAEKFSFDVQSEEIEKAVAEDLASGNASAVQGTPTFFLNGKKIQNPRSYEEFKKLIIL